MVFEGSSRQTCRAEMMQKKQILEALCAFSPVTFSPVLLCSRTAGLGCWRRRPRGPVMNVATELEILKGPCQHVVCAQVLD